MVSASSALLWVLWLSGLDDIRLEAHQISS